MRIIFLPVRARRCKHVRGGPCPNGGLVVVRICLVGRGGWASRALLVTHILQQPCDPSCAGSRRAAWSWSRLIHAFAQMSLPNGLAAALLLIGLAVNIAYTPHLISTEDFSSQVRDTRLAALAAPLNSLRAAVAGGWRCADAWHLCAAGAAVHVVAALARLPHLGLLLLVLRRCSSRDLTLPLPRFNDKMQFQFVPLAGILGSLGVAPMAAIGCALLVDAIDTVPAYAVLAVFTLLSYFGVFNAVTFTPDYIGHFTLLYEVRAVLALPVHHCTQEHTGPYKNIGTTFDRVGKKLSLCDMKKHAPSLGGAQALSVAHPINIVHTGLYFDDPKQVPTNSCRAIAGWLIHGEARRHVLCAASHRVAAG